MRASQEMCDMTQNKSEVQKALLDSQPDIPTAIKSTGNQARTSTSSLCARAVAAKSAGILQICT
jgi:hypothetical protein